MKYVLLITFSMLWAGLKAQDNNIRLSATGKSRFAGTWLLVAVENTNPDGSITLPYGEHPAGMLVLTDAGDYAIQILKTVRPKVAAKDKSRATPEENAALVQGNNSHFGRYTVDETKQVITFDVQHAFYPNWEGKAQVRSYTLTADHVLTYIVTNTTNGGAVTAKVVWKKK